MLKKQHDSHACGLSEIFSDFHPDEKGRGCSSQRRLSNAQNVSGEHVEIYFMSFGLIFMISNQISDTTGCRCPSHKPKVIHTYIYLYTLISGGLVGKELQKLHSKL